MKKNITVLLLAAVLLLSACTPAPQPNPGESTAPPQSEASQGTAADSTADPSGTEQTGSTQAVTPETSIPETGSTETSAAQTESEDASQGSQTQEETESTEDPSELIGTLYTRGELYALSGTKYGYGPGPSKDGKRPEYALGDQKRNEKYGANFIAPDNGKIYLTFDCGYEYNNVTADILDTLKEKDVKAVFFVTMHYVKDNPELVQRRIDEGHTVGNHSNHHYCIPDLSVDEMAYEIMSLHEYVLEHFGYEMTLFRPPEGAYSTRSLALTQSLGYKTVHWSFAYVDWDTDDQPDPETALNKVTSSAHSGAIYLLHAVSETNAAILADAIDSFRDQGYTLELFG